MRGRMLRYLVEHEPTSSERAMPVVRIILAWALMSAQGVRRLVESAIFAKPSMSKMWFVHWILGIAFYTAIGVAVWIEGAGKSSRTVSGCKHHDNYLKVFEGANSETANNHGLTFCQVNVPCDILAHLT